ncbi:helix-turn-helix domain-containing protein [Paenibacillus silviterrae]|uniref:helix-turn-helix domain-containing protein n=1 Tax=Paenibacillus silviterrae TaxID=3242194 RepID=UPI002543D0DF|nr:helix-turn-helix domain-containing protein [Paenibacillus chinjuensis]
MLLRIFGDMWSRGSMRLKILIAASLLSIVPVIILGSVTYMIAEYSLFDEVGKANRETVKQVQQRIDEKLVSLDKAVLQHAFNPMLLHYLTLTNPYENGEQFRDVMTVLSSMEGLIDDANAVYLYMKDQNLMMSPSQGITTTDRLPRDVLEKIQTDPRPYFWLDRKSASTVTRGGSNIVTFVRKLPVNMDKPLGYLIVELNDRAFFDIFAHTKVGMNGEMLIVTSGGNYISDWNKSLLDLSVQNPVIDQLLQSDQEEHTYTETIGGQKLLLNYRKSPYNEWKYISLLPVHDLTSRFNWIKQTTLGLGAVLIGISLAAAAVLSGSFFRLIYSVVETIKQARGELPQSLSKLNEIGVIRYYVDLLHRSNHALEQQIADSMPILRTNFLHRLLTEPMKEKEIVDKLAYYGIDIPHPYYTVLSIELDNLRGQTEQDLHLFLYAAMNIAKEIMSRYTNGVAFQSPSDHIAVILNHGPGDVHDRQKLVFQIAEEMQSVAERLLRVTVTIGIGYSYEGLEFISRSNKEALEALQFQLVEGSGRVIYIGSVLPEANSVSYPSEQEQVIINGIKLCHVEQVVQGVADFAAVLSARGRQASYDHIHQSYIQLIATSLKTLFELDPEGGPKLFDFNPYQRLAKIKTHASIVCWLTKEIYPDLISHVHEHRNRRQRTTMDRVLQYIHEHYDEELSQPMLAELVSLPNSQFSAMFKEEMGMTLTDYIIAYRIDRAKELLRTTDMKISDIAEKLCYNNAQNFIRMFKRSCGITPGEYRSRAVSREEMPN